jgi:hypothetical protein
VGSRQSSPWRATDGVLAGAMGFMHLNQQKWSSRTFSYASQKISM